MSILQCMQFHASYDEESYNKHKYIWWSIYYCIDENMCKWWKRGMSNHNKFSYNGFVDSM